MVHPRVKDRKSMNCYISEAFRFQTNGLTSPFNNGVNLHQLKTYEEPKGNKKPILSSNVKSKAKMPRECKLISFKIMLR